VRTRLSLGQEGLFGPAPKPAVEGALHATESQPARAPSVGKRSGVKREPTPSTVGFVVGDTQRRNRVVVYVCQQCGIRQLPSGMRDLGFGKRCCLRCGKEAVLA
jgi:hypothetical protein